MSIKNYALAVIRTINELQEGLEVEYREVTKNNNTIQHGIMIKELDSNVAPTIYVNEYYDKNICIKDAAEKILESYKESKVNRINVDFFRNYQSVRPLLRAKLVSAQNEQYAGIIASDYGYDDLKIVPYVTVNINGIEGNITVKDEHLALWNIAIEEVVAQALQNIKDDYEIQTMDEVLNQMTGMPIMPGSPMSFMYVVTNQKKVYGAIAAIIAREAIKNKLGENYVVLPSSIHEVICLKNDNNLDELTDMVRSVNASVVDPADQLSDKAYVIAA